MASDKSCLFWFYSFLYIFLGSGSQYGGQDFIAYASEDYWAVVGAL